MKRKERLMIQQLDKKMAAYQKLPATPRKGWVFTIRTAMKMSLRQFGEKLGINFSSAKEIEQREQSGSITIKSLRDAATALNMRLIYSFVPAQDSLEEIIKRQAEAVARKIVMRTSQSMKLEDQEVRKARLEKSIKELAEEIRNEMPRYLWD